MISIRSCQITFQNDFTKFLPIIYKRAYEVILRFFFSVYYRDYGVNAQLTAILLAYLALSSNDFLLSFYPLIEHSKRTLKVIFQNIFLLINIINESPSHLAKSLIQN